MTKGDSSVALPSEFQFFFFEKTYKLKKNI